VLESKSNYVLLQRADGGVSANIVHSPQVMNSKGRTRLLASQLQIGDLVTVYGRVQKSGDMMRVKADGIYVNISPRIATLCML
jgi:hypothetical protein